MASLSWRNLYHDRVRFGVTLTGIVFAIVLIVVQLGMFIGFTSTTSAVIDNAGVDLWIATKGLQNFDSAAEFSERKYYQALSVDGVAKADKYVVRFVNWKKPDGGYESIEIVGFNPDTGMGGPWNITAGAIADLKNEDTIMVDELYREKLGFRGVGQTVEIQGRRARIVGATNGIRSFTTSPFVFTWYKNALDYGLMKAGDTVYILIKAAPGVDLAELRRRLLARISDVEIYTTPELSLKTQNYWMFTTGAGVALLIAAFMGLVVGVVVVAQTIYATTVDHIREFGTLKAMGASNGYIYRVIVKQAVIAASLGYGLGMAVSWVVVKSSESSGAVILLPWELALGMFALSVGMCVAASVVSIRKVMTIDPALVFKA